MMERRFNRRKGINMDSEIQARFDAQDIELKKIYDSAEKTRKYFMWTLLITIGMMVLPLIGLLFALPSFIKAFSSISSLMGF